MKVRYTSANGQLVFDVEAPTSRELFAELGSIQELFEAETKCGCCGSNDIRFSWRVVDEFNFYELVCRACRAQFRFGQKKKTLELFPKRKDEDGNTLPNGGWSVWEPQHTSAAVPSPAAPVSAPRGPISTELQLVFDRLGISLDKPAPTKLSGAVDMLREAAHGDRSKLSDFDRRWRQFEFESGSGGASVADIKSLLADLWHISKPKEAA